MCMIKLNSCDQIKTVVIKAPKVMICVILLHGTYIANKNNH